MFVTLVYKYPISGKELLLSSSKKNILSPPKPCCSAWLPRGFIEKVLLQNYTTVIMWIQEETIKAIGQLHPHDANYSQYPTVCSRLALPVSPPPNPDLQSVLQHVGFSALIHRVVSSIHAGF